jgi:hypothetical protein
MTFRQLFGTDRYKKYRHGKKRKRNGGELKSIDQIVPVQNEENTRDGDFLVKPLACIAHKSLGLCSAIGAGDALE